MCNLLVINLFYNSLCFSYTLKQTVESISFHPAVLPASSQPQAASNITRIILPRDGNILHSQLTRQA